MESYWVLRGGNDAGGAPESVATDGRMEIILHLADPFEQLTVDGWRKQPRQLVSGQITRPVALRPTGQALTLGIRLKSWAGHAVLQDDAWRLTDQLVELEAVNSRLSRALRPLLALDKVASEQIDALLESCLRHPRDPINPRICAAVACTERSGGRGAVDALRHHTGIGTRQLERLFQQHVGVGPKLFARMVRFRSVLKAIRGGAPPNWADVAADSGYADQAHLIRDFRQFAGCTPRVMLEDARNLNLQFANCC